MKPARFEYHAPQTVDDAVALLAEHADDVKPLAGGQSLVPMLALRLTRFEHLVDLNRVEGLAGVTVDDRSLVVGATTRQRVLERSVEVAARAPLLALAAPHIGHFQIRSRGTVGGSLAHADPASELPAVALALDATLDVAGPGGRRTVAAADFFLGTWTTALADDELLVAARFPEWTGRAGFALEEVARRRGDFALAGAAAAVALDHDGRVQRVALGLFGLGPTPVRPHAAEAALVGRAPTTRDLEEVGRLAVEGLDPPTDVHASGAYRASVGAHVVAVALARAVDDARAGDGS